MNIHIKKINDKTVNNLEATPSFTVVFDIKGHAVMDLLKKFSNASVTGKKLPQKRQMVESSEDPFEAKGNSNKGKIC